MFIMKKIEINSLGILSSLIFFIYILSLCLMAYRLYSDIQSIPPMKTIKAVDDWTPISSKDSLFLLNGGEAIVDQWTYRGRVMNVVKSSKAAMTGPFLAYLKDGKAVPVEDMTALDRGQTLLGNLHTYISGRTVKIDDIYKHNLTINFLGVALISVTLFLLGWKLSAIGVVLVTLADGFTGPFPSADTMGIFHGLAGLGISSILFCWLACLKLRKSIMSALPFLLLSFFCLTWTILMREPIGKLTFVVQLVSILIFFLRSKRLRQFNLKHLLLITLVTLAPLKALDTILMTRNILYNMSSENVFHKSHGLGHNLYIGLGTNKNPWGLKYDDNMGRKLLEDQNSPIKFASSEYYTLVLNEYVRLIKSSPKLVTLIYFKKFKHVFSYKFGFFNSRRFLRWMLFGIFVCSVIILRSKNIIYHKKDGIIFPVLLLIIILILLQGVLAIPDFVHIYPAYILSTYACFLIIEFAINGCRYTLVPFIRKQRS